MSRLIREEDLLDCLGFEGTKEEREENAGEIITLNDIDAIPTAINLDLVVGRLEKEKDELARFGQLQVTQGISMAINMIRGYEEAPLRWNVSKERPRRPTYEGDGYAPDGTPVYDTWYCPNCGASYEVDYDDYDYCPSCGQRIDWGDEE